MNKIDLQKIAEKYANIVFRTTLSFCNSIDDAEDAVQNAFCQLLKTDTKFNDDEHIRRWLVKVAINECKMMYRSYWRKNSISFEELNFEPEFVDDTNREVLYEVMKLSPKYRSVLHLYYYEGYSCKEIAKVLKISESAVQTRLLRARNILKEKLKEV